MSTGEPLYLRQDVQVEPLVDQWYAWSHLIPPATASRNITERHLRIMDSYISAPQVHASAVKNPAMLGGPFIDYRGKRVDEIRALRDRTRVARRDMLELSKALAELDAMLRMNARGFSLHQLYCQVPDILRGYVELVYDLNNNAAFRLIEPLLYRTRYYDATAQSLVASITTGDDRPFVLSTPRLQNADSLDLHWGFADERIDALFDLKYHPRPWGTICDSLGVSDAQAPLFKTFLTPNPPPPYESYRGDGVRWRYFGHACILVECGGLSILLDPVLSYTYESDISRYTYADLPNTIDYVVITHNHQDHILFETLLQLRRRIRHIIVPRNGAGALQDPSLKLTLEYCGFTNVQELRELDVLPIPNGSIMGVPFLGEHCDLAVTTKLAYLIQLQDAKLLFAADSCNIEHRLYEHLHAQVGDLDVLFLGMECDGAPLSWLYGPLLTQRIERAMDESRRLSGSNYEQAERIVSLFNCQHVYVYAMGQEPWLNHVMSIKYTDHSRPIIESNRLVDECRRRGIVAERLFGEKEILLQGKLCATACAS